MKKHFFCFILAVIFCASCKSYTRDTARIDSKSNECSSNFCLSPEGQCEQRVQCFQDPCGSNPCDEDEICASNYCGGCNSVCTPKIDSNTNECSSNFCLSPEGKCERMVKCIRDPCGSNPCDEDEICVSNYCGGCNSVCTPKND